jgi:hypothetical protein
MTREQKYIESEIQGLFVIRIENGYVEIRDNKGRWHAPKTEFWEGYNKPQYFVFPSLREPVSIKNT